MATRFSDWEVPASLPRRLLWLGGRLLAWFLLYAVLETGGAMLLNLVPLALVGPAALLGTVSTLFAALAAGYALLQWIDHRPARTLGFDLGVAALRMFGWGAAVGAAILLLVTSVELIAGWLRFHSDSGSPVGWAGVLLRDFFLLGIAAAAEEAVFRGYAFQAMAAALGGPAATIAGSIAFALAHSQNPNLNGFAYANIFLAGVLLSLAVLITRSLWFATAIHLGWNWAMASLLDLPVSGLELFDTPLYEPSVTGPLWFTGGAFGPEGGLAGTIAFVVGSAFVLKWGSHRWLGRVDGMAHADR